MLHADIADYIFSSPSCKALRVRSLSRTYKFRNSIKTHIWYLLLHETDSFLCRELTMFFLELFRFYIRNILGQIKSPEIFTSVY